MLTRHSRSALAAASSSSVGRYFSAERLATAKPQLQPGGDSAAEATLPTSKGGQDGDSAAEATLPTSKGSRRGENNRVFSLVFSKRSPVFTLKKWKEEGLAIRKFDVSRVLRELRKLRRYKHALEISEWMKTQKDISFFAGDYAVELDLISKVHGLNSAEKFFADLPENLRGSETCTALMHAYVQNKADVKAEALIEQMSERGLINCPLPYNHLLKLYISNEQFDKVGGMIREMKKVTSLDTVSYNLWLTVCSLMDDVETAEKVRLEMQRTRGVVADWMTFSILASLYAKNSMQEKAMAALIDMEKRISRQTRSAYCSLISLNTNLGQKDGLRRIWKKLKLKFHKLNDAEYSCMISSLIKLEQLEKAEKLYSEWESVSPTRDARIANLLLAAYINRGNMDLAKHFHEQVVKNGVRAGYTSWELLTWGYLKQNQMKEALECFEKAVGSVKKWEPDGKLTKELCTKLEEQGDVEGAEKLLVILKKAGCLSTSEGVKDKVELDEEAKSLSE